MARRSKIAVRNRDPVWDEVDNMLDEARVFGAAIRRIGGELPDQNAGLIASLAMVWRRLQTHDQAHLFEQTINVCYGKNVFERSIAYCMTLREDDVKENLDLANLFKPLGVTLEFVVMNWDTEFRSKSAFTSADDVKKYIIDHKGIHGIAREIRNRGARKKKSDHDMRAEAAKQQQREEAEARERKVYEEAAAQNLSVEVYLAKQEKEERDSAMGDYNNRLAAALAMLINTNDKVELITEDGLYLVYKGVKVRLEAKHLAKLVGFYAP